MQVQVQFNCPVGVIVDTDTGSIVKVIVWDEHLDSSPREAHRDDYIYPEHPEYQEKLANESSEMQQLRRDHPNIGLSVFEPLPLDHDEVKKALAVVRDDSLDWPAWQFGA